MITWFYGNTESGKTTLARALSRDIKAVLLDGDDLRMVWTDLGLDKESRVEQNNRAYKLAKLLESQGFNVIVATICPYKKQRDSFVGVKFIYIPGGKSGKDYPFEND